jgi:hypothetical protein
MIDNLMGPRIGMDMVMKRKYPVPCQALNPGMFVA